MSDVPGYRGVPQENWVNADPADASEAVEFIREFHAAHPGIYTLATRLATIRASIAQTGTYRHTPAELTYGARLAWRNSSRCIGRLYWNSLYVRDRRTSRTGDEIYRDVVEHLRIAARGRRHLRPVITVFPPAEPGRPYARIWNEQLIRYAGYREPDGSAIGDPRYVDFTAAMASCGYLGKGSAFDVLPLAIETPADGVRLYDLPSDAILEVPISHPDYDWFDDFGLRWHAIPAIANMRLSIGGVEYPCAPFNGWYMGTEIGARNLADADRYNMLPIVASRLGVDTSRDASLWRDRALVELNIAVLWSFERAGVQISDHHTESRRFLAHIAREARAGREVPADWTWIVPPISGSTTPVFHRYYAEEDLRPNFFLDDAARQLGHSGAIEDSRSEPVAARCPVAHGVPSPHIRPPVPVPYGDAADERIG
jgi:nitric-oxide synthase